MAIVATLGLGLRVIVDVQHIYRFGRHARDRGSVFTLPNGTRTTEATAATLYAAALTTFLRERGAVVVTNDATRGILVGPYSRRNAAAQGFHAYLACHVNAGGGSYAAFEYMSTTRGAELAGALLPQMAKAFPRDISDSRRVSLNSGVRGAVCIQAVPGSCAAVILEPFFGDNRRHQHMLQAPNLVTIGAALGQGVIDWWRSSRVTIV